jgi:peptidoglycan/xylan/chitin deacetylase (PgdA/CDA1 family)
MSMQFQTTTPQVSSRRTALNAAAGTLWYVPGSFKLVCALGPQYSLRCVLFHDISDTESVFTKGLAGTITRKKFEAALEFLTEHYNPVSLQDIIASFHGHALPARPVLVTFDDAYASVSEVAAPICAKFGVPAVFFVNGSCLDNRQLALDNLVCYVANVFGLETINATIQTVEGHEDCEVRSLAEVFGRFLPHISLSARKAFQSRLVEVSRIRDGELAGDAGLYLSSKQLRDLASFNFEIGDHTYGHVHCRSLLAGEFAEEIDRNRTRLELVSGKKIRSFSVPYGSSGDLTPDLENHLKRSGYEAIFLAEGCANSAHTDLGRLDRVSLRSTDDAALFSEVEVLPRLRTIRNRLLINSRSPSLRVNSHVEERTTTAWRRTRKDSPNCSPIAKENSGL